MKPNWQAIVQGFVVALLVAICAAAIETYIEVKMLRKDVDRLEEIVINVIEHTVK